MLSQTDINEAFNSTSRYLDGLLNIDNPNFEQLVGQIYQVTWKREMDALLSLPGVS